MKTPVQRCQSAQCQGKAGCLQVQRPLWAEMDGYLLDSLLDGHQVAKGGKQVLPVAQVQRPRQAGISKGPLWQTKLCLSQCSLMQQRRPEMRRYRTRCSSQVSGWLMSLKQLWE